MTDQIAKVKLAAALAELWAKPHPATTAAYLDALLPTVREIVQASQECVCQERRP